MAFKQVSSDEDEPSAQPSVTVTRAAGPQFPLLLSFPHSGDIYPDDFGYVETLPYNVIDFPSDKYVDELFSEARALGLDTIRANFPRAYVDVNRHQHDIDETMLDQPALWYGRLQPTALREGSTLFWSTAKDVPIYDRKLSRAEAKIRLAKYFVPYHQALTAIIEKTRQVFGCAYVIDCHSMMQFDPQWRGGHARPEVDIGTRFGESCADDVAQKMAECFEQRGYQVGINQRFAGGEITLRYGWPEIEQHILQVELRRDLYMNEETRTRNERFSKVKDDCSAILREFKQFLADRLTEGQRATRERA